MFADHECDDYIAVRVLHDVELVKKRGWPNEIRMLPVIINLSCSTMQVLLYVTDQ